MPAPRPLRLDASMGLSLGARERQEDAVVCAVPADGGTGIAVLADGLGGHVAGAEASRLAVETAIAALSEPHAPDLPAPEGLRRAVAAANAALATRIGAEADLAGMGTTLIAVAIVDGALWWASVGDSLLLLRRGARLHRLNEIHSLAWHLDLLAAAGEITPEAAARHPERHSLTSALGGGRIDRVDCPEEPIPLMAGDTVILASDGLATLDEAGIAAALDGCHDAEDPAAALLAAVADAGAEAQDNTSVAVLRVQRAAAAPEAAAPRPARQAGATASRPMAEAWHRVQRTARLPRRARGAAGTPSNG